MKFAAQTTQIICSSTYTSKPQPLQLSDFIINNRIQSKLCLEQQREYSTIPYQSRLSSTIFNISTTEPHSYLPHQYHITNNPSPTQYKPNPPRLGRRRFRHRPDLPPRARHHPQQRRHQNHYLLPPRRGHRKKDKNHPQDPHHHPPRKSQSGRRRTKIMGEIRP